MHFCQYNNKHRPVKFTDIVFIPKQRLPNDCQSFCFNKIKIPFAFFCLKKKDEEKATLTKPQINKKGKEKKLLERRKTEETKKKREKCDRKSEITES